MLRGNERDMYACHSTYTIHTQIFDIFYTCTHIFHTFYTYTQRTQIFDIFYTCTHIFHTYYTYTQRTTYTHIFNTYYTYTHIVCIHMHVSNDGVYVCIKWEIDIYISFDIHYTYTHIWYIVYIYAYFYAYDTYTHLVCIRMYLSNDPVYIYIKWGTYLWEIYVCISFDIFCTHTHIVDLYCKYTHIFYVYFWYIHTYCMHTHVCIK